MSRRPKYGEPVCNGRNADTETGLDWTWCGEAATYVATWDLEQWFCCAEHGVGTNLEPLDAWYQRIRLTWAADAAAQILKHSEDL